MAQSQEALLQRAEKFLASSSKTDQIRAYNDFKTLYLQSVMDEDARLKERSLQGIVKSGEKLKIDVAKYKKELLKRDSKASNATSKKQKVSVTSIHLLQSIEWHDERLVLVFDRALSEKQLNYFTVHNPKKKQYRYIFDIHASMLQKSKNLKHKDIDSIKIAQFNQATLRLEIVNSQKLSIGFKRDENLLVINTGVKSEQKKSFTPQVKEKRVKLSEPEPSVLSKYTKKVSKNKVIVIDPGHGGKDPGAIGYKSYREKVIVLDISKKLRDILKSRGYRVFMTRDNDRFLKLSERTVYANKRNADLFVSIHANAVAKKNANKVYGIECYFLDKSRSSTAKRVAAKENSADMSEMDVYGKESFLNTLSSHNIVASNKLAIDLQGSMLRILRKSYSNIKDGGVRSAPFWVLVGAQMPSVLVEVGFITNPTEAQRLVNAEYQKRIATGLADGIERYFINN